MKSVLHPVILPVPAEYEALALKERPPYLSRYARLALRESARYGGTEIIPDVLPKDEQGVPIPFDGNYWSLTHKPEYVGAVISSSRIGTDIEKIRPMSDGMYDKVADDQEWSLGEVSKTLFFRYWTAKESVLKAVGTGIAHLSLCKIIELCDEHRLMIDYAGQLWLTEHLYFDGHIATVVKNESVVRWMLMPPSSQIRKAE